MPLRRTRLLPFSLCAFAADYDADYFVFTPLIYFAMLFSDYAAIRHTLPLP